MNLVNVTCLIDYLAVSPPPLFPCARSPTFRLHVARCTRRASYGIALLWSTPVPLHRNIKIKVPYAPLPLTSIRKLS